MTPQELSGLYAALGAAQLNHEKVEAAYPAAQKALDDAQAALAAATAARQPAYDAVQAAIALAVTTLLADARAFHTAHNAALVASGAEKIGVTGAPGM